MATTSHHTTATTYTIAEPLDEDGACSLHHPATDTTYRIVDYADPRIREKVATRTAGETVRLDLSPADPDGLDWIATRLRPGAPLTPGGAR